MLSGNLWENNNNERNITRKFESRDNFAMVCSYGEFSDDTARANVSAVALSKWSHTQSD